MVRHALEVRRGPYEALRKRMGVLVRAEEEAGGAERQRGETDGTLVVGGKERKLASTCGTHVQPSGIIKRFQKLKSRPTISY